MKEYIITNWTWLILLYFIAFMIIRIIKKVIKNERNRKTFSYKIKPGDKVYSPILNDKVEGEVIEVNNDSVIIKITLPKNRIYINDIK